MNLPRAILLDLDNTVYEYAPCQRQAMAAAHAVAAAMRKEWGNFEVFSRDHDQARGKIQEQLPGHAASHCRLLYFKTMFDAVLGGTRVSALAKIHGEFWKGYFAAMRIDPGCADTLERWRKKGIRLAWVTNFTTERQMGKLEQLGLADAADFLVTSEEAGADKPSPLAFRLALAKLGVSPRECFMIGDDWKADVEPSLALGMTPIFRRRGSSTPKGDVLSFESWEEISSKL